MSMIFSGSMVPIIHKWLLKMRLAFLKGSYQRDQNAILEFMTGTDVLTLALFIINFMCLKKKNLEGLVGFLCYVRYDLLWARILGPREIIILIEWLLETHLELEKLHNSTSSTVLLSVRSSIPQKKLTSLPELQQLPIVYYHNTLCFLSNTWHILILYLMSYLICIFSKTLYERRIVP